MKTFTPSQAQSRFEELLDLSRQGPVRIIEQGNILGVLVSAQDYDAMRTFHADRASRQSDDAAASTERFRTPDNERPR